MNDPTEAAQLIAPRLAARAAKHDAEGVFPKADFDDIRRAGLLGLMVPERLGGIGAGFEQYVEVAMTLAAASGATALIFNMHTSICGALARTSDDLARTMGATAEYFTARDHALKAAADGAFYAVAMSERGVGPRLSAVTTSYEEEEDCFRIRGSKAFVSGAGHADAYLVAARNVVAQTPEISHFLIPTGEGLTVERTWDSMGMRATGSDDLHIDSVVDRSALLGGVAGLSVSLAMIMPQWLVASYAAVYVGVAQSAVDAAVAHLVDRKLGNLASVRARIGRAEASVAAARLVVREAATRIDSAPGEAETNRWVYRAKLLAGETAMDVAASMLEAAGTSATRRGNPLERIYRDARCGSLQPATSDVCADWLGIAALGGNPDKDGDTPRW